MDLARMPWLGNTLWGGDMLLLMVVGLWLYWRNGWFVVRLARF